MVKKHGGVSTKDALEGGGMGHHSGLRRVGGIEHELVDLMATAFGMDPSGGGESFSTSKKRTLSQRSTISSGRSSERASVPTGKGHLSWPLKGPGHTATIGGGSVE